MARPTFVLNNANCVLEANGKVRKIANNNWGDGANSLETFSGDCSFEFNAYLVSNDIVAGFATGDPAYSYYDTEFGIYLNDGLWQVRENSTLKTSGESFTVSDRFKIEVVSNVVRYYVNNVLKYTSLITPVRPLSIVVAVYWVGSYVTDTVYTGNVNLVGGDIFTKSLCHFDNLPSVDAIGNQLMVSSNPMITSTQSKFGSYSAYFDGVDDYISVPSTTDFDLPGDFTIDFWMNPKRFAFSAGEDYEFYFSTLVKGNTNGIEIWRWRAGLDNGTGVLGTMSVTIGGINYDFYWAPSVLDTWHHIAVVRSSGTLYLFANGVLCKSHASVSASIVCQSEGLFIGCRHDTSSSTNKRPYQGYIDELRISKGIARWTTNFTPPTTAYTTDAYTKLLCHFDTPFSYPLLDESGRQWNANGGAITSSTQKKFGSSTLYLSNGSYVSTTWTDDFNFGSGDFTIDWWEYVVSTSSSQENYFINENGNTAYPWCVGSYESKRKFYYSPSGTNVLIVNTGAITTGTWIHRAIVRNGNSFFGFANGILQDTQNYSGVLVAGGSSPLKLIAASSSASIFYIDELRISKGIARWTANFTPPTTAYGTSGFRAQILSGGAI